MKKYIYSILIITLFNLPVVLSGQNYIGINTPTPDRELDAEGSSDQYIRVHCTSNGGGEAAVELIIGGPMSPAKDFKLTNDDGDFKIMTTPDNFQAPGTELLRINGSRYVGIGTNAPVTQLHINNGEEASNTEDGFLMLGTEAQSNMIFDPNEITVRNNGVGSGLVLQSHDGNTFISNEGGDAYFGEGGGNLGIGTATAPAELSIDNDDWQIMLRNTANGVRDWFIGAGNLGWAISDNQLVFSPSSSSTAAALRLHDVSENGGTVAPVFITNDGTQTMLFDGNEIDGKDDAIYINHNSNQETYLNPSGGRVGIGTTEPNTTLHINKVNSDHALRIQHDDSAWDIEPNEDFGWLGFIKDGWTVGHIDGASGQWVVISDKRYKNEIQPLDETLAKIRTLPTWTYSFISDTTHSRQMGVIAQEAIDIFPEVVSIANDTYRVAYSKFSVILLRALQEQQKEIDVLQAEINEIMRK